MLTFDLFRNRDRSGWEVFLDCVLCGDSSSPPHRPLPPHLSF